jgi:polyphenol oxidase
MFSPYAYLQANWPAPPKIRALTTLRSGPGESLPPFDRFNLGLRCGDEQSRVVANRQRLARDLELADSPRWLQQVHGIDVVSFDASDPRGGLEKSGSDEPVADASVTTMPDTALAILTADCLPVLFCSEDGSEIAAAHAGWRGLSAGMLEATVRAMRTPPAAILAWLGPAAGPQAYEIGAEVRDAFLDVDQQAAVAFKASSGGHWLVDLFLLARLRLASVGVTRVYGGGICTISDPQRFYSHRRDQRTGRMATVIVRRA